MVDEKDEYSQDGQKTLRIGSSIIETNDIANSEVELVKNTIITLFSEINQRKDSTTTVL